VFGIHREASVFLVEGYGGGVSLRWDQSSHLVQSSLHGIYSAGRGCRYQDASLMHLIDDGRAIDMTGMALVDAR